MVFKKIIFQNRYVALETSLDPPPFMANAILNFHFDFPGTSLNDVAWFRILVGQQCSFVCPIVMGVLNVRLLAPTAPFIFDIPYFWLSVLTSQTPISVWVSIMPPQLYGGRSPAGAAVLVAINRLSRCHNFLITIFVLRSSLIWFWVS